MPNTPPRRADALRNVEVIGEAATALLATDPDASVNDIARAAGEPDRVTLYGHFDSRATLIREVARRAIADTDGALSEVDIEGDPREALGRLLEASWEPTHRYGALVVAGSSVLGPEDLRRAHDEPAARVRGLLQRGRDLGQFGAHLIEWQISTIQALLHAASAAVHRGEITADDAPLLVRDTTLAALSA